MSKMILKSLITQIRGVSYQKGDAVSVCENDYIPLLRANNIQDGDLVESDLLFIPNKLVNEKQIIKNGDIIIAASSGSINIVGKAGFSKRDTNFTFGAFCKLIRPNTKKVHPEYLNYFFQSQEYRAKISSLAQGANINNLKNENIDCLEVLIPALPEQKRIATILDKADALRQKNKQLLAAYDELLQSIFLELFGDPVRNNQNWPVKLLSDVSEVVSGVTKGRKLKKEDVISLPYIRVANVQDGHLDLNEIKTIDVLPKDLEKYRLLPGDILLTEGGDPDKLGRGAVWKGEIKDCIHQNHIFRVRIKNENLIEDYLSALIGSVYGKKYFLKASKQTTGIASINSTQLKKFPVIMAPIKLQRKFKSAIENIELQKALVKQSLQESEDLFNGLVQKAFKGELTDKKEEI
jgi:type I restriction enzyme S subunit